MKTKIDNSLKLKILLVSLAIVLFFIANFLFGFIFDSQSQTEDYVKFINVGKSDSALIYSNGYSALIDTGNTTTANDVALALNEAEIETIDVLIITHLHKDHTGGLSRILETYNAHNIVIPKLVVSEEGFSDVENAINIIEENGGKVTIAKQGTNFKIGDFEVTVLAHYSDLKEENNRSLVLMAKLGDKKFLFTGDIEEKVEKALINEKINLKCDVLKVAHHGSKTSSSEDFIKAAKPSYAVINTSSDENPEESVISTLNYYNAKVLRTDECGDITFKVIDNELKLYLE